MKTPITPRINFRYRKFLIPFASLLTFTGSSCGVPKSSDFAQIPDARIPFELNIATTTTSTTVSPSSDGTSEMIINSGQSDIDNESVDLYFIINNRLIATSIQLVSPATTSQVFAALVAGPPSGDAGLGLRSAVAISLKGSLSVSKGIAIIDSDDSLLTGLSPIDQRLAIAQLVLTFTSRPGIGQVLFSVNGEQIAVPRGKGDLSKPGSPVSFDDYISLLADPKG